MRRSWTSSFAGFALILTILFITNPSAHADMWTNAAGHAIEARLVGGDEKNLILERPDGSRISMPVMSFSPGARQRAEKQLGSKVKKYSPDSASAAVAHARALHKAGQISDEELQATLDALHPAKK